MLFRRPAALARSPRIVAAFLVAIVVASAACAQDVADPPQRVARLSYLLGDIQLLPAGSDAWITDLLNRPLVSGDRLWADRESRAELHVGSAAIRLGAESALELLNVDDRTVQLKLATGTLGIRVRALAADESFEIDTPTAALSLLVAGEYRIDVDEPAGTLRVATLSGQIAVIAGSEAATVLGGEQASYSGEGLAAADVEALPPGDAFDQWAAERDRRDDRAAATPYLSREVTGYEDLPEYGSWQTSDDYGPVWTPVVRVGWVPYHTGHWAWIAPWGWTWIDAAPWGFAPFHYGRWLFVNNRWCWAPGPRSNTPVFAPALVAWVAAPAAGAGASPSVAWFPLGWNEVYRPSYHASSAYLRAVNVTNIHATTGYVNSYLSSTGGSRATAAIAGVPYRNQAVAGAVTATTRDAFASAQPVEQHPAELVRDVLVSAPAATLAPPIAPSAPSVGRRSMHAPSTRAGMWTRPVVARLAPPAPPAPFEQQRRAVVANGGYPVAAVPSTTSRPDIRRARLVPLPRPLAPSAPASAPAQSALASSARSQSVPTPSPSAASAPTALTRLARPVVTANEPLRPSPAPVARVVLERPPEARPVPAPTAPAAPFVRPPPSRPPLPEAIEARAAREAAKPASTPAKPPSRGVDRAQRNDPK